MPAGGTTFGFLYFAAAKFCGYTAFCRWAIQPQVIASASVNGQMSGNSALSFAGLTKTSNRPVPVPSAWGAGAIRTAIGLAAGAIVGFGFWAIPYFADHYDLGQQIFFVFLVPVRICEWLILLNWVYRGFPLTHKQRVSLVMAGIAASFLLDGLGILSAFIFPGGIWVC